MVLKDNLKKAREKAGLSQPALAKAARVSQQSISRLENGIDLTSKKLPQIAKALHVPVHDLDPNYRPEGMEAELLYWLQFASDDKKRAVLELLRGPSESQ